MYLPVKCLANKIFTLMLQTSYFGIWEPATLAIKREGYSIRSTTVVTEKFSPSTTVRFCAWMVCDLDGVWSGVFWACLTKEVG